MNRVEIESFLKSFLLFFISLGVLIAILFYINYTKEVQTLDTKLFSEMRVCSFDLKCKQFEIDFIPMENQKLYKLYKNENGLSSFYPIPTSEKNIMALYFKQDKYDKELQKLQKTSLIEFFIFLMVIFILSILFSFYALYPLRNALTLTQEFIKDILHDFNTPLASLRLNTSMLKLEIGENEKINRLEQSVANILYLQEHLRSYLHNHSLEKSELDLNTLIVTQVHMIEKNYPNIHFKIDIPSLQVRANKEAFIRIIDNLLTNACKYNKPAGSVKILYIQKTQCLEIIDTGKGIQHPQKVFHRFYKEQERGIGIGLHIVKKLCDELDIKISIKSILGQGSIFSLNLSKLILS